MDRVRILHRPRTAASRPPTSRTSLNTSRTATAPHIPRREAHYRLSITAALDGPFASWLGNDDWTAWFAAMKAIFCEPMSRQEKQVFRQCTGLASPPSEPIREFWGVCGRKGRKTAVASLIACYAACYGKWLRGPGERLRVLLLAASKNQATLARDYCEAILRSNRGLARLITSVTADSIELANGILIETAAASYRTVRGPSVVCAIGDETAFWRDENSANPDIEIWRALKPATIAHKHALLIGISSPYARRGLLYERYRDYFGKQGSTLVWQASSTTMNPQLDPDEVEKAYAEDEAWARAEFGAQFRTDVEQFLSLDAITSCVMSGVRENSPRTDIGRYFAFVDPSGGSSDSMTLAIAHRRNDNAVLDLIREATPPFSPQSVVADFAMTLRLYRCSQVQGDCYAGHWVREAFQKEGITYQPANRAKSDLYGELIAPVNSGRVKLLDHKRLVSQLVALERRTARSGKDSIDHPRGAHDDVANAATGALVSALEELRFQPRGAFVAPSVVTADGIDSYRRRPRGFPDPYYSGE